MRGDFLDRFDRGVRLNGGVDGQQDVLLIEHLLQAAEVLIRALAAAGDDEGAAQAFLFQNVRHAQETAGAGIDLRRAPGQKTRADSKAALERAAEKWIHGGGLLFFEITEPVYHKRADKKRGGMEFRPF